MRPSGPAIAAAVILAAEGVALTVVCVLELFALGAGGTSSLVGAVAMIVLTLLAAAALCAFAFGTVRRASWARSGGILFQVLAIALGLASLGIEPTPWVFTVGVGLPGVAGLILLISAVRRDGASDPRLHTRDGDAAG